MLATAGIILAAIYILWMYQRTMTGPVRDEVKGMPRPAAAGAARGRAAGRAAHRRSASTPSRCSTSSTRRSRATLTQVGTTDPGPPIRRVTRSPPCRRESHRDRCPGRLGRPSARRASSTASSRRCWSSSARPCVGVLVEAFAPRSPAAPRTRSLTLGRLVAAFVLAIVVAATHSLYAAGSPRHVAAEGAVAVDRPTLFIQGTHRWCWRCVSVLLIAERQHRAGVRRSWPGRDRRGSQEERERPGRRDRCTPRSSR